MHTVAFSMFVKYATLIIKNNVYVPFLGTDSSLTTCHSRDDEKMKKERKICEDGKRIRCFPRCYIYSLPVPLKSVDGTSHTHVSFFSFSCLNGDHFLAKKNLPS